MDKTSFFWTSLCSICHPGGGPGEYDRDGHLYYDVATQKFGYELENKTPQQVQFDGDYAMVSSQSGALSAAAWDQSGVSEPDCLYCHRSDRTVNGGTAMNWVWRAATLRAAANLIDSQNNPVPGFAAAPTASQGWFSQLTLAQVPPGKPPLATVLQIDYQQGVSAGVLAVDEHNALILKGRAIHEEPRDYACWGCHLTPDLKKRGRSWFNADVDVHYAAFNRLNDVDPLNDVPAEKSTACTVCHPSEEDHNIGKGNAILGSVQNATDYEKIRTCRDCHLKDSPDRDPAAPVPTSLMHQSPIHMDKLACQFCHIPYRLSPADLVVDNATTGATIGYSTQDWLSSDPLDPTNADKSRWYPAFKTKKDEDGKTRLFPVKNLRSIWWGDWDEKGPGRGDDVVSPIILWRLRGLTQGQPLQGVADDNLDGKPEVNTLAEIEIYLLALASAVDRYSNPLVANKPVLIKGGKLYYYDATIPSPPRVASLDYHTEGIKTESSHPFAIDHNVFKANLALGATGCAECHKNANGGNPTPVFDRKVLVDPFFTDNLPRYETVRDMLSHDGIDPK
jgi:hypothetical protein